MEVNARKSEIKINYTWNKYASPKAVLKQKMYSRLGCSGIDRNTFHRRVIGQRTS